MHVSSSYRLTLYRQSAGQWHYCQLTASDSGWLQKATGRCGSAGRTVAEKAITPDGSSYQVVVEAGAEERLSGFDYPTRSDLKILSLHFKVMPWNGFPVAAPWFEDWKTFYQEPFEAILENTVNGFSRGLHRARGHLVLYYYVLDGEAAKKAALEVQAMAPVKFPMEMYLGDQEFRPGQQMHSDVPKPLSGLFEQFGAMANTVAEASHNILFHTVALTPQLVVTPSRNRIKGLAAIELRKQLNHRWNFECGNWPPLGGHSPTPVITLSSWTIDRMEILHERLVSQLQHPAYLLDCDDGVFALEPGHLLRGVYEGTVFDASLEWIIYFSHRHTVTFGGAWLLEQVRDIFASEIMAI